MLGNDHEPENQSVDCRYLSGPAHGSLTLNADGSFTYTPTALYFGTDTFTYQANDGTVNSLSPR